MYCSEYIGTVIASYSYRSDIIDKLIASIRYCFLGKFLLKVNIIKSFFAPHKRNILENHMKCFRHCKEMKIFVSAKIRGEDSTIL
jgi:hypothetical protein